MKKAKVDIAHCVGCGACMKKCPKLAINVINGCYAQVDSRTCIGCGICVKACPASVIEVCEESI